MRLCLTQNFLTNQAAGGSIVRALGKQLFGAAGKLVGFYGIGIPIGASLMFAAKMGIFGRKITFAPTVISCTSSLHSLMLLSSHIGLWTGLLICVFLQSVFFIVLLIKLNWVKATKEVRAPATNIFDLHAPLYTYYISDINTWS